MWTVGSRASLALGRPLAPSLFSLLGVRAALTPLSLLQARAAESAGALLGEARARAATASREGDGDARAPTAAELARAVHALARDKGVIHPAWVLAAPLVQV